MANNRRNVALAVVLTVASHGMLRAEQAQRLPPNIRVENARIKEVIDFAMEKSPSFTDLVATFEYVDRVVYLEEGTCHHRELRSCLQLLPTPGGHNLLVRVDPRQPIRAVVLQLAHELYHALEVSGEPAVEDSEGMRAFYERIGEHSCDTDVADCFETRAAVTFERLVGRQLAGSHRR